jgi:nucleoid DNA-binding protein
MAKKKTAKRTARKKVKKKAARRATARAGARGGSKAAASGPKSLKLAAADRPRTKSEIFGLLAESAGISKKEVAAVFDGMSQILKKDLSRNGPGAVNLGGMMKVTVQRKPATKARKGINPFTGEETIFKAKPARNVVKVRPMKALKDLV